MWRDLTTSDWISIIGTAVSIVGFLVAIVQLRRVATAVRHQQQRIAGAMLQSRTGELERIEHELGSATARRDAQRAVRDWRRHAADLQALLDASETPGSRLANGVRRVAARISPAGPSAEAYRAFRERSREDLDNALEVSLALVDIALREVGDTGIDLDAARQPLLNEISIACRASRSLGTDMMIKTP